MALEKVTKQIYEAFFIAGSMLKNQDADEVVDLVLSTVAAQDVDGNDVSNTVLLQSTKKLVSDPEGSYVDNALSIQCRAGLEVESPYIITFYMTTDKGNKWEVDMKLVIKEVPAS